MKELGNKEVSIAEQDSGYQSNYKHGSTGGPRANSSGKHVPPAPNTTQLYTVTFKYVNGLILCIAYMNNIPLLLQLDGVTPLR